MKITSGLWEKNRFRWKSGPKNLATPFPKPRIRHCELCCRPKLLWPIRMRRSNRSMNVSPPPKPRLPSCSNQNDRISTPICWRSESRHKKNVGPTPPAYWKKRVACRFPVRCDKRSTELWWRLQPRAASTLNKMPTRTSSPLQKLRRCDSGVDDCNRNSDWNWSESLRRSDSPKKLKNWKRKLHKVPRTRVSTEEAPPRQLLRPNVFEN